MTRFRFVDSTPRVYPTLSREFAEGDELDAEVNPDPTRFVDADMPADAAVHEIEES